MKVLIKILSFAVILMVVAGVSKAQDTICFNSGDKAIAVISEINNLEIKYKEFSNPTGPNYIIDKNSVSKIVFKNGNTKFITSVSIKTKYCRNIFSYHLFDIVYRDFSMSYEHVFKSGNLGIKIPVAVGYNTQNNNDGPREYTNLFYSGVGLNVYLMGQRMASYFIGPELHMGKGQEAYSVQDNNNYTYNTYYSEFFYWRFIINNGISFSPIPNFRLTAVLGIGVRNYKIPESDDYNGDGGFNSTAYFTMSMGYRF